MWKVCNCSREIQWLKNSEKFSSIVLEYFVHIYKNFLKQWEVFSRKLVISQRLVIKLILPGLTLAVENLPYQQDVQSNTLSKTSFISSHRGCVKKHWTEIFSTGKRIYEIIISTKRKED